MPENTTMPPQQNDIENSLRIKSLMRWHIGDWAHLSKLDDGSIALHPDRALLATLKAASLFQQGDLVAAQILARAALGWGAEKKALGRAMVSGFYNSLGRIALLADQNQRAEDYFKEAMRIGANEFDGALLYPARLIQQRRQVSAKVHPHSANNVQVTQSVAKPSKEQKLEQQQQITTKINQAKTAHDEKNYRQAEQLLSDVLYLEPNNTFALKELARLKSEQKQWVESVKQYDQLLKAQRETESAILTRSLMKKNADLLEESIADLEHAKALGFYNSQIAHNLAVAYRDNQQWEEAESTVRELLTEDTAYLANIRNATFVADLLRKRQRVSESYALLTAIVEQAQIENKEVPLNTRAILRELQHAVNQPEYCREVSRHYYDAIYAESEKYQVASEHSVYLPVWEKTVEILKQEGVRSVLDIGCGPGQFAEYVIMQIPGVDYQGIDYSQTAIKNARLRCPNEHFHVKDLMDRDALEGIDTDAFLILEVLEHVEKDLELIARIPAGKKVIFSLPNMDSFGHLRFFRDGAEIIKRYGKYIDDIRVVPVALAGRSKIFISVGNKSEYPYNDGLVK